MNTYLLSHVCNDECYWAAAERASDYTGPGNPIWTLAIRPHKGMRFHRLPMAMTWHEASHAAEQWNKRHPTDEVWFVPNKAHDDDGYILTDRRTRVGMIERPFVPLASPKPPKPAKLTIKGSWQQFVKPLRDHEPFTTGGSLYGRPGPAISTGRLPDFLIDSARAADYVVYSYATPIAWHVPGMTFWLSPGIRYSVTTSMSQGRIFTALSQIGQWDGDVPVCERGWETLRNG